MLPPFLGDNHQFGTLRCRQEGASTPSLSLTDIIEVIGGEAAQAQELGRRREADDLRADAVLGRKNNLFVGSQGGGKAAALAYTLIETAKLNGIDPQAWLTYVLGKIADQKITRLDELMPWRYAQA